MPGAKNPEQLVDELVAAIDLLASNKDLRHSLGSAARMRIRENYLWSRKIEWIVQRYDELLVKPTAERSDRFDAHIT